MMMTLTIQLSENAKSQRRLEHRTSMHMYHNVLKRSLLPFSTSKSPALALDGHPIFLPQTDDRRIVLLAISLRGGLNKHLVGGSS
jgi:hypothetical protein